VSSEAFLVGLELTGRACLVVGSDDEAARRATALARAGALVTIVAEAPNDAVRALAADGTVTLAARVFAETDLDGVWLAVLGDRDATRAERMARAAEARRVFFCAVDQPSFGSFSHLALARAGALSVGISTRGRAPALARRLREELERLFRAAGLERFVEGLAALRARTPSAERARVLGQAVANVRFTGALELPEQDKQRS
jgi:siroheme synthase-like protein